MRHNVHYVPIGLGTEHYVTPLTEYEPTPDEVVLLVPANKRFSLKMIQQLESSLPNKTNVKVNEVQTTNFTELVADAYTDLREGLLKEGYIYINVSSPYWPLGAGYALAATYLVADAAEANGDSEQTNDDPLNGKLNTPRNHITLYHTAPEDYRIEELRQVANEVANLRSEFLEMNQIAQDLQSDVESDKQTIETLASLIENDENSDIRSILEILDHFNFDQTGDDEIRCALQDIINGIELTSDGISTLAEDENRAIIESAPLPPSIDKMAEGLAAVSDRPDSDSSEITPADLVEYFADRLSHVNEVLENIETKSKTIEVEFEHSPDELKRLLEKIRETGVAEGVQTFGNQTYTKLPGPLQFGLSTKQRAILCTLYHRGPANSIADLPALISQEGLETVDTTASPIPDDANFKEIKNDSSDAETLIPKETVRDNLKNLEKEGFVSQNHRGQSKKVTLTKAGEMYVASRSTDLNWQQETFLELFKSQ